MLFSLVLIRNRKYWQWQNFRGREGGEIIEGLNETSSGEEHSTGVIGSIQI